METVAALGTRFENKSMWRVDLQPNYNSYYNQRGAIVNFVGAEPEGAEANKDKDKDKPRSALQLLIGTPLGNSDQRRELNKLPSTLTFNNWLFIQLNRSQQEAITKAMGCRLYCVQGPPGTGKTKVAEALLHIKLDTSSMCLATAQSNVGADNLASRLLTNDDFKNAVVRYGLEDKITMETVKKIQSITDLLYSWSMLNTLDIS